VQAQTNQYLSSTDSDPEAVALLRKLQDQLQKDRLAIDFDMTVTYPGEEPVKYNGQIFQQGKMYRVQSDQMQIWSNGQLRWIYDKSANEVSLYSANEDAFNGPLSLLSEYSTDKYVAIVTTKEQIRSLYTQALELKPVDRNSDIAKVRLFLQPDGKPVRIEVMEKSGMRTMSDVLKISTPEKKAETYFTFNKADYPNVHVEDLRID
jgi:outer membrane lipoprotein-sorting protein